MRYSKDTKAKAQELINSLYKANAADANLFSQVDSLRYVVRLAKQYSTIQEHECNGTLTPRMRSREANIEKAIRAIMEPLGLRVAFGGDPRSYTVKVHSKKGDLWNTMGGPEEGYGIG